MTAVPQVDDAPAGPSTDILSVERQRFAVVPQWVIDANLGDTAFRLYAVLLRYGQSSGLRMPSRATLARRLHKHSVDTVDRALRELVNAGAVEIERRRDGRRQLTNRYHLRTSDPGRNDAATPKAEPAVSRAVSRIHAATPGRVDAASPGRSSAVRVAAALRPDPEQFTDSTPPPTPSRVEAGKLTELLAGCDITDLDTLATRCQELRRSAGQPAGRWTSRCLSAALQLAVSGRGWPAGHAAVALLAVAGDPDTRSPMRLAEAGPWWDERPVGVSRRDPADETGTR